jgi:hypothetical protein
MAMSVKSREWKLIIGLLCMLPGSVLAVEPENQQSSNNAPDQPVAVESPPPAEGEDSGVRSRAPSSGSLQSPAMRQLQKVPIPRDAFVQMGPVPANLILTAVNSTSIKVEWTLSPGATRYLISRNGAPDIVFEPSDRFLNGNRFTYIDGGRKPATLHTYSVTAEFPAPTLPGKSAPAQVVTPSALPPQSFSATVSGPNSITLSWAARPEATRYYIIRNSLNLPVIGFQATGTTYVDQNLPPGEYTYLIYSVVRLATGEEVQGELSNPVMIKTRPFNIVAVGDSVMWGQGLSEGNKFTTKVGEWLKSALGKSSVLVHRVAHSGAVTYPDASEQATENTILPGEVPSSNPSIGYQITNLVQAKVPPLEVDLVLVDGCINNVGVTSILNPFKSEGELRGATRAFCTAGMINILTDAARKFPNAKVIVNGYFPIVSQQSNLASVVALWLGLGILSGGLIPPDPVVAGGITAGYRERAAVLSEVFFNESTNSLQSAVNNMNALPPPLGGNRFRYAALPVNSGHAYSAPNTWLWLIPARGIVEDEVFDARSAACNTHQSGNLKCYGASMGHPNVQGAQAYTDAIKAVAAHFLPEWRQAHVGPITAGDDMFLVNVHPGAIEPGGGTMEVTVDGPFGRIHGTVQLNGKPAGVLNSQIRYAFERYNPTDVAVKIDSDFPGFRPRFFTIPIRTQFLAVNLTNNANPRTAVVTATDSVTGQQLSGRATIQTPFYNMPGPTGQPLTYPSCGQAAQDLQFANIQIQAGPVPCTGFVQIPHYPDASFQDLPGATPGYFTNDARILTGTKNCAVGQCDKPGVIGTPSLKTKPTLDLGGPPPPGPR